MHDVFSDHQKKIEERTDQNALEYFRGRVWESLFKNGRVGEWEKNARRLNAHDNAALIATAGYFHLLRGERDNRDLGAYAMADLAL